VPSLPAESARIPDGNSGFDNKKILETRANFENLAPAESVNCWEYRSLKHVTTKFDMDKTRDPTTHRIESDKTREQRGRERTGIAESITQLVHAKLPDGTESDENGKISDIKGALKPNRAPEGR
jgi:hypothetical protein